MNNGKVVVHQFLGEPSEILWSFFSFGVKMRVFSGKNHSRLGALATFRRNFEENFSGEVRLVEGGVVRL